MSRLSAYLIVKNEERDLPGCLETLKGLADEIIVVDDNSTDRTLAIAGQFGAKTFSRTMDGYGSQKQFALDQCTCEWALSLDADERLTPALVEEIRRVTSKEEGPDGYDVSRLMFFLGQRLRFGGVGRDWVLRLFRRTKGKYLPKEIHERIEVNGKVGRLQHPMNHFSYATLDEYLAKIPAYTALSAQARWQAGQRFSLLSHLRPGWELFSRVILKGAWLDGQAGLIYAALSSHAAWLKSVKLWDIENCHDGPPSTRLPNE